MMICRSVAEYPDASSDQTNKAVHENTNPSHIAGVEHRRGGCGESAGFLHIR